MQEPELWIAYFWIMVFELKIVDFEIVHSVT